MQANEEIIMSVYSQLTYIEVLYSIIMTNYNKVLNIYSSSSTLSSSAI